MKSLLGVLCVVLVLVYGQADPTAAPCPETRNANEMHHMHGDWVLVFTAYGKKYENSMPNLTSSFVEVRLQDDNHTLFMTERTLYDGGKCAHYMFLSHDDPHDGHLHLKLVGGTESKEGVTKIFADNATMDVYPSDDHEMKLHYKGELYGSFLLIYRRAGQHVYGREEEKDEHRALAKCLHLHGDEYEEWHYHDEDFCHKPSVLATLDDHELHQVDGDWVLLWMVYDKTKEEPYSNFSSSHMELKVNDDNHTIEFHEYNHLGEKCVEYSGKFVLRPGHAKIHTLDMVDPMEIIDGNKKDFDDTATLQFFPSPPHIMEMYYKSKNHGNFLLEYRQLGHHTEVEGCERDKHHEEHEALAKYLGLSGDHYGVWHYDGKSELCQKKAAS